VGDASGRPATVPWRPVPVFESGANAAPREQHKRRSRVRRARKYAMSYCFLLPAMLLFAAFKYYPMVLAVKLSFQKLTLQGGEWIGLANFQRFLLDEDAHHALLVTGQATLLGLAIGMPFSFLLALLLSFDVRGKNFFRAAFFVPYITPAVATVYVWKLLFAADFGTIAHVFRIFGWESPAFLADFRLALYVVIFFGIWKGAGYTMLIYLAALESLDPTYYDAARIDGANFMRYLWSVMLPLLRPITWMLVILGVIGGLKSFTSALLMTAGGPNDATMFFGLYVYYAAFRNFQFTYAAALGMILLVIILAITLLQWRRIRASI
jgi:multiple sugar transport system permease protein